MARWGRAGPLWAAGAPAPPPPRAPGGWRCPACPRSHVPRQRSPACSPFPQGPPGCFSVSLAEWAPAGPLPGPGSEHVEGYPSHPCSDPTGGQPPTPSPGLPAVPPSVSCHRPACHTAQGVGPPEAECQTSRHARLVPGPGGRSSAQLLGARVALVTGQESQCRGPMWGGSLPGQSTDLGYRLRPKAETVLGVSHMKSASPGHQGPCPVGNELGPYRAPLGTPV